MNFRISSGSQINRVEIKIFDISGQQAHATSVNLSGAGASLNEYTFYTWDLRGSKGHICASGTYIYQMKIIYENGGTDKFVDKFTIIK